MGILETIGAILITLSIGGLIVWGMDKLLAMLIKRSSVRLLILTLLFLSIFIDDLYNTLNNLENMYAIRVSQANGQSYMTAVFDLIMSDTTRVGWIAQTILILMLVFWYLKNKQKEDTVLNALLQLTNRGEVTINLRNISEQTKINDKEILNLFHIFKSNGKLPYDAEIIE